MTSVCFFDNDEQIADCSNSKHFKFGEGLETPKMIQCYPLAKLGNYLPRAGYKYSDYFDMIRHPPLYNYYEFRYKKKLIKDQFTEQFMVIYFILLDDTGAPGGSEVFMGESST